MTYKNVPLSTNPNAATVLPVFTYNLESDFNLNLKEHGSEVTYSLRNNHGGMSLAGTTLTVSSEYGDGELVVSYLPQNAEKPVEAVFYLACGPAAN